MTPPLKHNAHMPMTACASSLPDRLCGSGLYAPLQILPPQAFVFEYRKRPTPNAEDCWRNFFPRCSKGARPNQSRSQNETPWDSPHISMQLTPQSSFPITFRSFSSSLDRSVLEGALSSPGFFLSFSNLTSEMKASFSVVSFIGSIWP